MFEKRILITGASSGIGYGTAEYLMKCGCETVLVARNEEKLNELYKKYPQKAHIFPFDLQRLDEVESIFEFCRDELGDLDGLLHSAGLSENCPVRSLDIEKSKEIFDVNYFAAVQLGKYFLQKKNSSNNASAVFMSSMASIACDKSMSQYAASKAAVNALVKSMSKESVRRRIRVNAIAPMYVDTPMLWRGVDVMEGFAEKIEREQPFGAIPVEQIAKLIAFLLSDDSMYITGAVIPVTGGRE